MGREGRGGEGGRIPWPSVSVALCVTRRQAEVKGKVAKDTGPESVFADTKENAPFSARRWKLLQTWTFFYPYVYVAQDLEEERGKGKGGSQSTLAG